MSISKITLKKQISFINNKIRYHSEEVIDLKRTNIYIKSDICNLNDPNIKVNGDHITKHNNDKINYHRKRATIYKAILQSLEKSK